MAIIRWLGEGELFSRFDRMQREMDRLLSPYRSSVFGNPTDPSPGGIYPPVNLYDNGEVFIVRAEVPGIETDKLDLSVTSNTLTLRGERKSLEVEKGWNFHRQERDAGGFRRALTLPEMVDGTKVQASFKNGVLEILLPRAEQAKQRKIQVTSN